MCSGRNWTAIGSERSGLQRSNSSDGKFRSREGELTLHDRRPRMDRERLVLYPELIYRRYRDDVLVDEAVLKIAMRCYYPEELLNSHRGAWVSSREHVGRICRGTVRRRAGIGRRVRRERLTNRWSPGKAPPPTTPRRERLRQERPAKNAGPTARDPGQDIRGVPPRTSRQERGTYGGTPVRSSGASGLRLGASWL